MYLIDFDGTIVDFWPRYHSVFCKLTGCDIALGEYIQLKRIFKTDTDLAEKLQIALPKDYRTNKAMLLEDISYIKKDQLLVTRQKLEAFASRADSILLTRRNCFRSFQWELDHLGLQFLSDKAVCISTSKYDWAKENVVSTATIIGDDIRDLQVALLPMVQAVMVLTGIGTEDAFNEQHIEYELHTSLNTYIDALLT